MGDRLLSRRDFVRAGGAAAGGGLFTTVLLGGESGRVRAAGLSADDVTVSSNDGTLSTLTVDPSLTVTWDGLGDDVANIETTVTASGPQNEGSVYSNSSNPSDSATSGEETIEPGTLSLLSGNDNGVLTASNFEPETDGGSETTDVTVTVDVVLRDSSSNELVSTTESVTFAVTVDDQASTSSVSGSLNTNGS